MTTFIIAAIVWWILGIIGTLWLINMHKSYYRKWRPDGVGVIALFLLTLSGPIILFTAITYYKDEIKWRKK